MDDFMLYSILSGSCISTISSSLVLLQLSRIKYKDFANFLIFLLVSTDLIMSTSVLFLIYPINNTMCLIGLTLTSMDRVIHKLLILYISYCMFSIIVIQASISNKFIVLMSLFGLLAVIISILSATLMYYPKIESNICNFSSNSEIAYMLSFTFELIPDFFILIYILWLYYKIRQSLKNEALCNNLKCASNRIFAKRLIGYGLVFMLFFIPFFFIFLLSLAKLKTDQGSLKYLWICFIAWYPLFDSIIYGCTKSFKRNLFNFCFKSPEFDMEEEVMFLLRNSHVIRPRFYLDMIGESERMSI